MHVDVDREKVKIWKRKILSNFNSKDIIQALLLLYSAECTKQYYNIIKTW